MPEGYVWKIQKAVKRHKKGKAMGGMVMDIRKEIMEMDVEIKADEEGVMEELRWGKKNGE